MNEPEYSVVIIMVAREILLAIDQSPSAEKETKYI